MVTKGHASNIYILKNIQAKKNSKSNNNKNEKIFNIKSK